MEYLKKYPFGSLAVVLLLGLVVYRLFFQPHFTTADYIKKVQQNVYAECRIADDMIVGIKQKLKDGVSFAELAHGEYPYPIYIFKGKDLLFWTDHNFHLIHRYVYQGFLAENCIRTDDGIFLVKKTFLPTSDTEYHIGVVIPIYRKYHVQNEFLRSHFNPAIFPDNQAQITFGIPDNSSIYGLYKTYLFSLVFLESVQMHERARWAIYLVSLLITVSFLTEIFRFYREYGIKYPRRAFAFLVLTLGLGRILMVYFEFPFGYTDSQLFKPELYASSRLAPSLGDLALNFFVLLLLSFAFWYRYPRLLPYKQFLRQTHPYRFGIACLLLILAYLSAYLMFYTLKSIYFNSTISLDFAENVTLTLSRFTVVLIFVAASVIFFIIAFVALKVCLRLTYRAGQVRLWRKMTAKDLKQKLRPFILQEAWGAWLLCTILFVGFWYATGNPSALVWLFVLYSLVRFLRMKLGIFKHSGYGYFVEISLHAFFCALIAAFSVYYFNQQKIIQDKKNFATKILVENDPLAEYFLDKVSDRIIKDTYLGKMNWHDVPKRVKRLYLDRYFDKYDINILLFDENGVGLNTTDTYEALYQQHQQMRFATGFQSIFLDSDVRHDTKKYVCFINLPRKEVGFVGFIVLELRQKKIISHSLSPLFFIDRKLATTNTDSDVYSYALFAEQQFMYSYGNFVYDAKFLADFEPISQGVEQLIADNYHHIKITENIGKTVVISSPVYPIGNIFANTSAFFLMLTFAYFVYILLYQYVGRRERSTNFTVKIQLYLSFAFFLPLVVVSILTVSIINNSHTEETKRYYIEKALTVSAEIIDELDLFIQKEQTISKFNETVAEIAKLTQSDINVFNKKGELIAASQSYMYENNLLANLINPLAFFQLNTRKTNKVVMEEAIGDFQYSSVYVSLKSHRDGSILGYIGIPFFGYKFKTDKQIIDVITIIMEMFTVTFFLLLWASYIMAKTLTKPLAVVTQKLRRTTFNKTNQPIDYHSNDEIGLLVSGYNRMLVQLEESRIKLARTEKEMAWREFAKQVAHEIKNPLTPMKLHLQQIQRMLSHQEERIRNAIASVVMQLDTVSEIITSFSSFAHLPLPQEEELDVNQIIRLNALMYASNSEVDFCANIPEQPCYVRADRQQFNRILLNLITNGIQAVPEGRRPVIHLNAQITAHRRIRIEVRDNGSGIPEEIQPKIYTHSFTTKANGSGIGLSVAKFGIEYIGGSLWFETTQDVGTSFFIELPLVR